MFNWKGDKVIPTGLNKMACQSASVVHQHETTILSIMKNTENREPHNIQHYQIPVIVEISIHLSTVLLCALYSSFLHCIVLLHLINTDACIYLKKTVKIYR